MAAEFGLQCQQSKSITDCWAGHEMSLISSTLHGKRERTELHLWSRQWQWLKWQKWNHFGWNERCQEGQKRMWRCLLVSWFTALNIDVNDSSWQPSSKVTTTVQESPVLVCFSTISLFFLPLECKHLHWLHVLLWPCQDSLAVRSHSTLHCSFKAFYMLGQI